MDADNLLRLSFFTCLLFGNADFVRFKLFDHIYPSHNRDAPRAELDGILDHLYLLNRMTKPRNVVLQRLMRLQTQPPLGFWPRKWQVQMPFH